MALDASARRRWLGGLVLLAALLLLIGGETVLKDRLGLLALLLYWLACFSLTGLAVVVAFLDFRAVQRRIRQEQRDLFETTLKKIETEAGAKRPQADDQRRRA